MKAAFATWNNRIAPVFDAARQAQLVEADSGVISAERLELFKEDMPVQKVLCLVEWGVGTLVCGAVSTAVHAMLRAQGIRVIPFVSGDLRDVIQAWISGKIEDHAFAMPGHRSRGLHG